MFNLGPGELMVLVLLLVVALGSTKLPEVRSWLDASRRDDHGGPDERLPHEWPGWTAWDWIQLALTVAISAIAVVVVLRGRP